MKQNLEDQSGDLVVWEEKEIRIQACQNRLKNRQLRFLPSLPFYSFFLTIKYLAHKFLVSHKLLEVFAYTYCIVLDALGNASFSTIIIELSIFYAFHLFLGLFYLLHFLHFLQRLLLGQGHILNPLPMFLFFSSFFYFCKENLSFSQKDFSDDFYSHQEIGA